MRGYHLLNTELKDFIQPFAKPRVKYSYTTATVELSCLVVVLGGCPKKTRIPYHPRSNNSYPEVPGMNTLSSIIPVATAGCYAQ